MSFDALIGQEVAVRAFQTALARGRLAHTYMVVGPEGVGKRTFARAAAKALLCEKGGTDACGSCSSCLKVGSGSHPDFFWLEPKAGRSAAAAEGDPSGKFISIDDARELQEMLQLKPLEAPRKVAVIAECEMMTEPAANSLLKLLEEPPARTILFLTTSRPDNVAPTILSRCQLIRMTALEHIMILKILQRQFQLDDSSSTRLADAAGGSVSRALWLATEEASKLKLLALQAVRVNPSDDEEELASKIAGECRSIATMERSASGKPFRERTRRNVKEVLSFAASFYTEVARKGLTGEASVNEEPEWEAALRRRAGELECDEALQAAHFALEAAEYIDQNVDVELVLGDYLRRTAKPRTRFRA